MGRLAASLDGDLGIAAVQRVVKSGLALAGFGEGVGRLVSDSVRREFESESWSSPSGASIPWAPRVPGFGEGGPLLGGPGGRMFAPWSSPNVRVTASSVVITTLPVRQDGGAFSNLMAIHRGGNREVDPGQVTVVRPKERTSHGRYAMQVYLGLTYGTWISEKRLEQGLQIPARPHGTFHPELLGQVRDLYLGALEDALAG